VRSQHHRISTHIDLRPGFYEKGCPHICTMLPDRPTARNCKIDSHISACRYGCHFYIQCHHTAKVPGEEHLTVASKIRSVVTSATFGLWVARRSALGSRSQSSKLALRLTTEQSNNTSIYLARLSRFIFVPLNTLGNFAHCCRAHPFSPSYAYGPDTHSAIGKDTSQKFADVERPSQWAQRHKC